MSNGHELRSSKVQRIFMVRSENQRVEEKGEIRRKNGHEDATKDEVKVMHLAE